MELGKAVKVLEEPLCSRISCCIIQSILRNLLNYRSTSLYQIGEA